MTIAVTSSSSRLKTFTAPRSATHAAEADNDRGYAVDQQPDRSVKEGDVDEKGWQGKGIAAMAGEGRQVRILAVPVGQLQLHQVVENVERPTG